MRDFGLSRISFRELANEGFSRASVNHLGNYMNPLANFLIKLKNASRVKHESIVVPYSKFIHGVCSCLLRAEVISGFEKSLKKAGEEMVVTLKYTANGPKLTMLVWFQNLQLVNTLVLRNSPS